MRVPTGPRLRVGPGDAIILLAKLPGPSSLGRLYVFAREGDEPDYSPYIPGLASTPEFEMPTMRSPLHIRLTQSHPESKITFKSDIDGWVRIYQEVDEAKDTRVAVKWKYLVDPELPWMERMKRHMRMYADKVQGLVAQ